MALLLFTAHGQADPFPDDTARETKATHLLKFIHYIEWPATSFESADSPIVIGLIGAPPLTEELERIAPEKRIENRTVVVKRLTMEESNPQVHILYIGRRSGAEAREWLSSMDSQPMLKVCDISYEHSDICAIKFVVDTDRLTFDISVPAAKSGGIKITAPLLTVARQVIE